MSIKFNYTSGEEYTLNGSVYNGYFNSDGSGNVYSGKYSDSNSKELVYSKNKISIDYDKSSYFKDRLVFDTIELPYNLDRLLVQPNEIVVSSSINLKFKYLHQNLIYLYSKMFFADTDTPVEYDKSLANYLYKNQYSFEWSNNSDYSKKPLYSNVKYKDFYQFDNLKKVIIIPFNDGSGISIMGISNTHVIGLTSKYTSNGSLSNAEFVLYTDYIDNNTLEKYQKLEDIVYDGEYLFITDSQINSGGQVFKYNINSFYTNNAIYNFQKFLLEPIGGVGSSDRYNKFKGCTTLGSKPNELWVFDSGNNCLKIYDSSFVFKKLLKLNDYVVLDIRYRKLDDRMYLLYSKNGSYGLLGYDSDFNLVYKNEFEDTLDELANIEFKRFAISEQDSNVFYVLTDTTVYKKFFTKPQNTFSAFNRDKFYINSDFVIDTTDCVFGDDKFAYLYNEGSHYSLYNNLYDIFVLGSNNGNYDDLFLIGNSFISHFKEYTNYNTLLKNINFNYYDYADIKLDSNEYVQSFVFNKEIFKVYYNTIQIVNNLKGKFLYEFDKYGELNKIDLLYLTDEEINLLKVDMDYDSYINDNELLNPNVINRIISKIYNLQELILQVTKIKITNLKTAIDYNGTNILNIS